MRVVLVRLLAAALLLGIGWVTWSAGRLEGRLSEANRQLAMLRYQGPLSEYDEIEGAAAYLEKVPAAPELLLNDLREERATAQYWTKSYSDLAVPRGPGGELLEKNPELLFMAANASFREAQRAGLARTAGTRALDSVVSGYADVLKNAPSLVDAAYNYEFVVRVRDVVAKEKPGTKPKESPAKPTGQVASGDLPAGPTLHGQPGGPPPKADMKDFKMMIPMEGEERSEEATAPGKGQRRVRKG